MCRARIHTHTLLFFDAFSDWNDPFRFRFDFLIFLVHLVSREVIRSRKRIALLREPARCGHGHWSRHTLANRHSWFRVLRFSKGRWTQQRRQLSPRRQRSKRVPLQISFFFLPALSLFFHSTLFYSTLLSFLLCGGCTQKGNEAKKKGRLGRVVLPGNRCIGCFYRPI